MVLYYDSAGKLKTMIPHGEPIRQGSVLNLYFYFDLDNELVTASKALLIRYKMPNSNIFSSDSVATYNGEPTFSQIVESDDVEEIGGLVNGTSYRKFTCVLGTAATQVCGNLEIAVYACDVQTADNQTTYLNPVHLGNATIYLEKTLGLFPNATLGMTRSEYEALLEALVPLVALKQLMDGGAGEFDFASVDSGILKINGVDISTLFAAKDGSATQDFKVKDLVYYKNNTPQSLTTKLESIQNLLDSLVNSDLNSWIASVNTFKNEFETFMTETSADNVINTLSEIRTEILTTNSELTTFKNTLSGIFTHANFSKIAVADNGKINVANLKSAIETVVDDMFADISEVEY